MYIHVLIYNHAFEVKKAIFISLGLHPWAFLPVQFNFKNNNSTTYQCNGSVHECFIMDSIESELIFINIPSTQAEYLPRLTQTQSLIMPSYSLTSQLQWLIVDANLIQIPSFHGWYNINLPKPIFLWINYINGFG